MYNILLFFLLSVPLFPLRMHYEGEKLDQNTSESDILMPNVICGCARFFVRIVLICCD